MSKDDVSSAVARRSFLAKLGAGVTAAGAFASGAPQASAQTPSAGWRPARHAQDDWLDAVPGGHRFVFDTTTLSAFESAKIYANNFYIANQTGYGLGNADAAVVIIVRHLSTGFGFNDAMWQKYGVMLSKLSGALDPKTQQPSMVNPQLAGDDTSISGLAKRGVQFAVCRMATMFFAGEIAKAAGSTTAAVNAELVANLIPNAHMVAAGIVALNRAQERGYTVAITA